MRKPIFTALLWFALPSVLSAQQFDFSKSDATDPAAAATAMPGLARQVIEKFQEEDRVKYLENLFRLQIVAGQFADARKSISDLRALLSAKSEVCSAHFVLVARQLHRKSRRTPPPCTRQARSLELYVEPPHEPSIRTRQPFSDDSARHQRKWPPD